MVNDSKDYFEHVYPVHDWNICSDPSESLSFQWFDSIGFNWLIFITVPGVIYKPMS